MKIQMRSLLSLVLPICTLQSHPHAKRGFKGFLQEAHAQSQAVLSCRSNLFSCNFVSFPLQFYGKAHTKLEFLENTFLGCASLLNGSFLSSSSLDNQILFLTTPYGTLSRGFSFYEMLSLFYLLDSKKFEFEENKHFNLTFQPQNQTISELTGKVLLDLFLNLNGLRGAIAHLEFSVKNFTINLNLGYEKGRDDLVWQPTWKDFKAGISLALNNFLKLMGNEALEAPFEHADFLINNNLIAIESDFYKETYEKASNYEKLLDTNKNLKDRCEEREASIQKYIGDVEWSKTINESLERANEALRTSRDRCEKDLRNQRKQLNYENQQLKYKNDALEGTNEALRISNGSLETLCDQYKKDLRNQDQQLKDKNHALRTSSTKSEASRDQYENEKQDLIKNEEDLRNQRKQLNYENQQLKYKNDALECTNEALRISNGSLETLCDQYKKDLRNQGQQLKDENQQLKYKNEALRTSCDQYENEKQDLIKNEEDLRNQGQQLKDENQLLKDENQQLSTTNQALRTSCDQYENEKQELVKNEEDLRNQGQLALNDVDDSKIECLNGSSRKFKYYNCRHKSQEEERSNVIPLFLEDPQTVYKKKPRMLEDSIIQNAKMNHQFTIQSPLAAESTLNTVTESADDSKIETLNASNYFPEAVDLAAHLQKPQEVEQPKLIYLSCEDARNFFEALPKAVQKSIVQDLKTNQLLPIQNTRRDKQFIIQLSSSIVFPPRSLDEPNHSKQIEYLNEDDDASDEIDLS